jgi:imidazolonepropionase-like amidohydrolase
LLGGGSNSSLAVKTVSTPAYGSVAAMAQPFRVRGTVLPDGELREIYVADAVVTYDVVPDADLVAEGWIVPGLVDAHCHVGLDEHGAVPDEVAEEQARTERDVGALLLRDAGSAADTRWIDDRDDLPRIVRAGRHLARPQRYIRNYAHEIEPHQLPEYVAAEADRGDGWVKLVGDWIDRERGDLGALWPRDALVSAIAVAHDRGARVTAHVFGEEALPDLLSAGIDCIEHGTGLSGELIDDMARNGTALVPTVKQLGNFPTYAAAGESRYPGYAAHMRHLFARRKETIRSAYEAGVPLYAGTDAGGVLPHGLIAAEVAELGDYGLSTYDALGAASWRAREWLGMPGRLDEGSPADFVVYAADPLADLAVLAAPQRIVLCGRVVT